MEKLASNKLNDEIIRLKKKKDSQLRDQFAMAALPSLIGQVTKVIDCMVIAESAYAVADAMMKVRDGQKNI